MDKIKKEKPFSYSLRMLNLLSVYPMNAEKSYLKMFYFKFWMITLMCFIVCCILPSFHLVSSIKDGIKTNISEDLSVTFGSIGTLIINIIFVLQSNKWSQLLHDLTDQRPYRNSSNFDNVKFKMNFFARIYFWYCIVAIIVYGLVSFIDTSQCKEINKLGMTLREVCGSFLQIRLPFEGNVLWIRLTIFFTQLISCSFALVPSAIICSAVYQATEFLITHIRSLKKYLTEAFDTEEMKDMSERLCFCIKYHNHIISLSARLNNLGNSTVGHLSLISAIVFASIGNQILQTKPIAGITYLIGYVMALFLLCHSGQLIIDETTSIGSAAYNSHWYVADAKIMRAISFIILRCQKPCTLDALPFGSLNYPLYLMIIKTSYSYLTLLQQST